MNDIQEIIEAVRDLRRPPVLRRTNQTGPHALRPPNATWAVHVGEFEYAIQGGIAFRALRSGLVNDEPELQPVFLAELVCLDCEAHVGLDVMTGWLGRCCIATCGGGSFERMGIAGRLGAQARIVGGYDPDAPLGDASAELA